MQAGKEKSKQKEDGLIGNVADVLTKGGQLTGGWAGLAAGIAGQALSSLFGYEEDKRTPLDAYHELKESYEASPYLEDIIDRTIENQKGMWDALGYGGTPEEMRSLVGTEAKIRGEDFSKYLSDVQTSSSILPTQEGTTFGEKMLGTTQAASEKLTSDSILDLHKGLFPSGQDDRIGKLELKIDQLLEDNKAKEQPEKKITP